MVECGGLEIRWVVLPSDTNQQLTVRGTTYKWGILGDVGSLLCNKMCNAQNFVQQNFSLVPLSRIERLVCCSRFRFIRRRGKQ